VSELYRGWHFYLVNGLQQAIQYVFNEVFRTQWLARTGKTFLSTIEAFVIGAIARGIATTVIYPAIRLKVVMQTAKEPLTPWGAVKKAMSNGPLGLFEGWLTEFIRGVLSSALMLACKERIDQVSKNLLLTLFARKQGVSS